MMLFKKSRTQNVDVPVSPDDPMPVEVKSVDVTLNVQEIAFGYVGIEDALGNKLVINADGSIPVTGGVGGGGGGAVTVANGADVALGSTTDPKNFATDATAVTAIALLKAISDQVQTVLAKESGGVLQTIDTDINSLGSKINQTTQTVGAVQGVPGANPGLASSVQGIPGGVAVAVSGTFWQATQPVSGTFWQGTQPVSIATMPTTPVTGTFWQATQPVSGTFWQATQPVSGTFFQATQPVSGTVTANAGTNLNTSALALEAGGNLATQTTQGKWSDPANRQSWTFSAVGVTGVTTEALLSSIANTAQVNAGAATSFTVPVGKTLRITSFHIDVFNTSTVASRGALTVRAVPPAGTLAASSPIVHRLVAQVIGAVSGNAAADDISLPEGFCLPTGSILGVSQLCLATTCTVSFCLTGYLY